MLVHIVMFKFKDENKEANIIEVKRQLEELLDFIPELKTMEVGVNIADEARAFDLSLLSTFDSKDDLAIYANHPKHLEVTAFVRSVVVESKVVDYFK